MSFDKGSMQERVSGITLLSSHTVVEKLSVILFVIHDVTGLSTMQTRRAGNTSSFVSLIRHVAYKVLYTFYSYYIP